jgi:phenylpyruvate tautomerase PptA (4-oxalocrotonate tautomerase family)
LFSGPDRNHIEEIMPTYCCTAAQGLLTPAQKAAIAAAITTAHSEVTGAPAYFAQVIFQEVTEGNHFIGGKPLAHDHLYVHGSIRSGRSASDREALIQRLLKEVGDAAGVQGFSVWVYLVELPPAAMAEFGHILPQPGEEAVWTDALPAADRARLLEISAKS